MGLDNPVNSNRNWDNFTILPNTAGCYEAEDPGITRMGREVIQEMNRVGLVVDMSHSAERSTLEAMEISARPIVVTHANPGFWHPALRNKSDAILKGLGETGGMMVQRLARWWGPLGVQFQRGGTRDQRRLVRLVGRTVRRAPKHQSHSHGAQRPASASHCHFSGEESA